MNADGDASAALRSVRGTRYKPIFVPRRDRPMQVVFFASGGPGNLRAALDVADELPELIRVGLVVTDRPSIPSIELAESRSIPVITRCFEDECGRWTEARGDAARASRYRAAAESFHDRILELIKLEEERQGVPFDLAILAYRRWIHGSLLRYFDERMINQHPGDLSVLSAGGLTRRHIGLDPVMSALSAGERRTRTSTFVVRPGPDSGEILCQGPWTAFGRQALTREAARAHENLQKQQSDWPSLKFALAGIARGAFGLATEARHPDGNKVVIFDGVDQPYSGAGLNPTDVLPKDIGPTSSPHSNI